MRPAGEVRQALLDAALALTTPERSPTLLELARHAQVGLRAARHAVSNMVRAEVLVIVRRRRVDYRACPVAEYCPRKMLKPMGMQATPLRDLLAGWSTPIV